MDYNDYCALSLYVFFKANKLMFLRDINEINRNVSERSFCANLKEFMNIVLRELQIQDYIADVEYNRGGDELIKAICADNEAKPIQCDLIIHSRGALKIDNLLCVEVKKKNNKYKVDDDKKRLIEMTRSDLLFKNKGDDKHYFVNGYKLGIFYVYDYKEKSVELTFFKNAKEQLEIKMSFNEMIQIDYGVLSNKILSTQIGSPRTITFYNMGFGDSFLINDSHQNLLVDCGSLNVDHFIWLLNKMSLI